MVLSGLGVVRRSIPFVYCVGRTFSLILLLAASFWSMTFDRANAQEFEVSGSRRWVVIASRESLDEAIDIARGYSNSKVFLSGNGWYAVVIGPYQARTLDDFLYAHPDIEVPDDTYLARGKNFVSKEWPQNRGSPSVTVASEGAKSSAGGCATCYLSFAWGFWNASDGSAHVSVGMGWGSSRNEAERYALNGCRKNGRNCELTNEGNGAQKGGCGYLSLGNSSGGVRAATASTVAGALELCERSGHDCDTPMGGCTTEN